MKKSLSENGYLSRLYNKHVTIIKKYSNISDDVTKANIIQIYYLSLTSFVVHIFHYFQIWSTAITPDLIFWQERILWIHGFFILFMLTMFILTSRYKNKEIHHKWLHILPILTAIVSMLVGISVTVLDQLITTNISPLAISSIVVGTVITMRPILSATIYLSSYILFHNLMELTIVEESILLSNRVNGLSFLAIGFTLSLILWQYFYTTVTQGKYIERQRKQLERMAYTDSLTGLPNRRYFDELLRKELTCIHKNNHVSTLLLVDIDDFKRVNDDFGHPVGDEVLKDFSELLADNLRTDDAVARFGGEEFIILITDMDLNDGFKFAERLRDVIEKNVVQVGKHVVQITSSFGIVQVDKDYESFDDVYYKLDKALRYAKEGGKNRVKMFTEDCLDA